MTQVSPHGLHHVTAIATDPQSNVDFYTRALGLRLVKQTVNFDAPDTYHLYYGDDQGRPSSLLTFFPWPGVRSGRQGAGMTTATAFSVPGSSLGWWYERFKRVEIDVDPPRSRDEDEVLTFRDPDGIVIDLVAADGDHRSGWDGVADIPAEHAVRGLHAITLSERQLDPSATMLTDLLGMSLTGEEGDRTRFGMAGGASGALVDVHAGVRDRGLQAGGTVHHVAFRAPDLPTMTVWQPGADRPRRGGDPDSGPAVLQVHLFPRAGRGALRDRHGCSRLRCGRAAAGAWTKPEAATVAGARPGADRRRPAAAPAGRRHPVTDQSRKGGDPLGPPPRAQQHTGARGSPLDRPHVFLPAAGDPAGPPLLLLHGTGGNEHDLLPLREHLSPGAAALSVRGTVLENGMPRFFRRLREGVFDEDDLRRRADELADFVQAASDRYGIADRSLVAAGFSNGANIASALLLRRPDVLAGAVLFAAMVPFAEPPAADLAGVPVVISNGDRDPMIPATMTEQLASQLRDRGAVVTLLPHPGGHQIEPGLLPQIRRILAR